MDEMHRVSFLRYFVAEIPKAPKLANPKPEAPPAEGKDKKPKDKKVKENMKPVKIDFALPEVVKGIEARLNSKNNFILPDQFGQKNKPEFLVGKTIRLNYLTEHAEKFVDEIITVSGWAREARLAAKDTILFVKLVDGSNTTPLQVVIEKSIPNW